MPAGTPEHVWPGLPGHVAANIRASVSFATLRRIASSRRYTSATFLFFVCLAVLVFVERTSDGLRNGWRNPFTKQVEVEGVPRVPPLYESFHEHELRLPQHDASLRFPEGKDGRYIWFANHAVASGLGNVLQETLLNAVLAHEAMRAFVFDNFTWNTNRSEEYASYNNHLIPSRIPFSAMVTGPAFGAPWPEGDSAPRSVRKEYFDRVCPREERTVINSADVVPWVSDVSAQGVLDRWVARLNTTESRCVEVDSISGQIFNIFIFGSAKRLLPIWPTLSTSPVLRSFSWSQLALSAFEANRNLYDLRYPALDVDPKAVIDGLLAIHVRRGDFETHCHGLMQSRWDFNGFNNFPSFLDPFVPPPTEMDEEEAGAIYQLRCLPSMEEIVHKVEEIAMTNAGLRAVYVMTNAPKAWADELVAALKAVYPWELAATSRDMALDHQQRYTAQTPDMIIGRRSQVFIGNGFSSLSSNIVMFRMLDGLPTQNNRFW